MPNNYLQIIRAAVQAVVDSYTYKVVSLFHLDAGAVNSVAGTDVVTTNFTSNGGRFLSTGGPFSNGYAAFAGTGITQNVVAGDVFGKRDFTIEMMVWTTSIPSVRYQLFGYPNSNSNVPRFTIDTNNQLGANLNGSPFSTSAVPVPRGAWTHVAMVRKNGVLTFWVGGKLAGGNVDTFDYSGTQAQLGADFNGYIAEFRATVGLARYQAPFTPPKVKFLTPVDGNWNNVSFLAHMEGDDGAAVFTDVRKNTIQATGNVKTSTTAAKFDGTGALFDGAAASYLFVGDSPAFGFGTGDFTMELWFKCTDTTKGTQGLIDTRVNGGTAARAWMEISGSNLLFRANGKTIVSAAITQGQWMHASMTRRNGIIFCHLDGSQVSTNYAEAGDFGTSSTLALGQVGNNLAFPGTFIGAIDEVRITKGVGRYVTNFIPSSESFPNA